MRASDIQESSRPKVIGFRPEKWRTGNAIPKMYPKGGVDGVYHGAAELVERRVALVQRWTTNGHGERWGVVADMIRVILRVHSIS